MSFKQYTEDYHNSDKDIPFKKRLGRCYELAGRFAMNNEGTALVHGSIEGFGNPRIGHAWVELENGKIWEPATGQEWDGDAFAGFFNPKLDEYYEHEELLKQVLRQKNWGPWE